MEFVDSERYGRKILVLFKRFHRRAGEMLLRGNLDAAGLSERELHAGLDFCCDRGWIERGPHCIIKLTDPGHAELQTLSASTQPASYATAPAQ